MNEKLKVSKDFVPGSVCLCISQDVKLRVKSMADEQEIMCKLESIKEIR